MNQSDLVTAYNYDEFRAPMSGGSPVTAVPGDDKGVFNKNLIACAINERITDPDVICCVPSKS